MCHSRFSREAEAKAGVDEPKISEGRPLRRSGVGVRRPGNPQTGERKEARVGRSSERKLGQAGGESTRWGHLFRACVSWELAAPGPAGFAPWP